jgi:pimeloyl-ACP methyl ester carboxylesterase
MKTIELLLSYYIKFISLFSVKSASDFTFKLFQKTQPRTMLVDEIEFYATAEHFTISTTIEPIEIYTKGDKNGEVVFMLHGWNSNLARLSSFAEILAEQGFYCVLFDMPGHGKSTLKSTNLKVNSIVFEAVMEHINPQSEFSVLTHSFGSMVASYTLARNNHTINQLFFLTTLNQFEPFFKELKNRLRLSDKIMNRIIDMGGDLLEEPVQQLIVKEKVKKLTYKNLSIFHDKHDKILPYSYSELLVSEVPNARLFSYENIGHSKMLQNEDLLADFEQVVKKNREEVQLQDV